MPIQNIQGLVNKNGLSYITNGEFISYYYNEGLANLGQRNVSDTVLKNIIFTTEDLFDDIKKINTSNQDPYLYIICKYDENNDAEKFYTIKNNIDIDINNINELMHVIESIQTDDINNLTENLITELKIQNNENISNESFYVLLNKKLNIIAELFDQVRRDNKDDVNTLFIPINYKFGYIANGINEYTIYNSFKDVYVNVLPVGFSDENDDYELENLTFYKSNIFYFTKHKYIKTDVYDYYFTAETNDELIIYCKKFTLPYIDDDDYWSINDQKTTIQAKAHDAINLNIILAHYYTDSDEKKYEFLSGLNNVSPDKIGMITDPYEFYIKDDNNVIKCGIKTPEIKTESLTKEDIELNKVLSNSTLVIISKLSDIVLNNETLNNDKYGNGYITTMWHYNSDENQFECICLDGYALDFNQLTNFENLLNYEIKHIEQVKPHNFLFSYLIFNYVHKELKQDTSKITYYYPVLQNIMSGKYDSKYNNDMNFSLKYINNIIRDKDGINIIDISDQLDIKYLKISSEAQTTNTLYSYILNNKVNNYNEFIPNYNIPIFDMSEFLIKDSNVMNKYNILTFTDEPDIIYYSYIGTSKDTVKNILTIGSSNLNINLGENTLTDANTKQKFKIQDVLNIDFDTINANGKLNVKNDLTVNGDINVMKLEWLITNVSGKESKSTVIVPQFKYYKFGNEFYKIINVNNLENDIKQISIDAQQQQLEFGSDEAKYYLYISPILMVPNSPINNMTYYYKYNDLLVLPNLVKYLGLNINDINTFESTTNEIISVNGKKTYLVSSNNILADSLSIVNTTDTGPNIETSDNKEFYSGNTLYITYIKSQSKLIVNEVQSHKVKSIWKIPTNIN